MKKLFIISVVLCIFSFICYWITVGILGYRQTNNQYVYADRYESVSSTEMSGMVKGDYMSSQAWAISNSFPDIKINSAGINTIVTRGEGNMINIRLITPDRKQIHVETSHSRDQLTIEVRSSNITFISDGPFGFVNWLDDIFTGAAPSATVIIEFPETKYDSLEIQQGSGSMKVHDLYAAKNKIHIGSGSFEFVRHAEGFIDDTFDFELGSGKAVVNGVQTNKFNFDIGSGSFDISGLSGVGDVRMGSGSGNIAFKEYIGTSNFYIGSGSMKVYVPEDSSIELLADIGSGLVSVDACDLKMDINSHNDGEPVHLGGGELPMYIDMGSGKVSVLNLSEYTKPVIEDIVISSYPNLVEGTEFIFSGNESVHSHSHSSITSSTIGSGSFGIVGDTSEIGYVQIDEVSGFSSASTEVAPPSEIPTPELAEAGGVSPLIFRAKSN